MASSTTDSLSISMLLYYHFPEGNEYAPMAKEATLTGPPEQHISNPGYAFRRCLYSLLPLLPSPSPILRFTKMALQSKWHTHSLVGTRTHQANAVHALARTHTRTRTVTHTHIAHTHSRTHTSPQTTHTMPHTARS